MVKIKAKIFWARWMNEFNTQYNEGNEKYECTLGDISDADAKKLEGLGIKMKQKKFASNVIVCKSKFPFIAAIPQGVIDVMTIGNGSEVEVTISSYTHKMSGMHGNAPTIVGKKGVPSVIVTKLLAYEPEAVTADEDAL